MRTRGARTSGRSGDAAPLVLVGGAVAQQPGRGGHATVFLSWLLGLRDLGCRVALVDRLLPDDSPDDRATQLAWLRTVLEPHGLPVLLAGHDRVPRADLLLDVMGYSGVDADRRVLVDVDPGFGQLWAELGLHDPYGDYDDLVTVGTAVGSPGSRVPTRGRTWLPVLPPVHLPSWPATPVAGGRFTTVASWRGAYGPVEHDGRSYGLRAHSFRRLLDARGRAGVDVELALDIDPADAADRAALLAAGYRLADPAVVAGTPEEYRRWVQGSLGELCVAKDLYVATAGGWFSDRSACYLASGRPVVAQDTGWTALLPHGEGLLAFADTSSAAAGLAEVAAAPARHGRVARELAEAHFDSRVVLGGLLDRLGTAERAA